MMINPSYKMVGTLNQPIKKWPTTSSFVGFVQGCLNTPLEHTPKLLPTCYRRCSFHSWLGGLPGACDVGVCFLYFSWSLVCLLESFGLVSLVFLLLRLRYPSPRESVGEARALK